MRDTLQHLGRRGIFAAAAGVLALAGGLTVAVGLVGRDGPPAPDPVATASDARTSAQVPAFHSRHFGWSGGGL